MREQVKNRKYRWVRKICCGGGGGGGGRLFYEPSSASPGNL
jgi:hypothetical protein